MIIYHNSRCRKSRAGLKYLEDKGIHPQIVEYLKDNPFTSDGLKKILKKLNLKPEEIIRKQEEIYRKNYKGKNLSSQEWVDVLVAYPKLIRRPIIEKGDKAIIGDDLENIDKIL